MGIDGGQDSCLCCNGDFVAFEEKFNCNKCGNTICGKCVRNVEEQAEQMENQQGGGGSVTISICKDCEFMGKWVKDVKAKDKGRFWNIKMPKRIFGIRRGSAEKKLPDSLNQKFSMVSTMLGKTKGGSTSSQRGMPVVVPAEIQQNLEALSREKLKEIHDQKKLISELQQENARIRQGSVDNGQMEQMKSLIDDLKRESETHIEELQRKVEQLKEQNSMLLELATENVLGSESSSPGPQPQQAAPAPTPPQPQVAPLDPKFVKYQKMLKAGLPEGAVLQAAARDGVELPGDFFTIALAQPEPQAAASAPQQQEDPKFAKYRKMMKAGLPEGAVLQAAARDGVELPKDFFTAPEPVAAAPAPAQTAEDPKFAKYRKMQKAGLPEGAIMQAAARDGVQLASDFFTAPPPTAASAPAQVAEDPKFAKFRKMQKAGLPEGAIEQAASRDGVVLPKDFFTAPAPCVTAPPQVAEDPKFAKYRKMQRAGLPDGAIMQAAGRDGVELPKNFFETTGPSGPPAPPALPGMGGAPMPPPLPGMGAAPVPSAAPPKPEEPKSIYETTKRKPLRAGNDSTQLRGIFWNVLPAKRVEGSFFTSLPDSPPFPMDQHFKQLESDFKKVQGKNIMQKAKASQAAQGANQRPPLVDSKRHQNLGIALARFKEPVTELKKNIVTLNQEFFTMEVVHKLISMVPTPEEVQAVKAAEGEWAGPGSFTEGLDRVEQFVYHMSQVPRLRQRLQCLFVEMSFERQSESLQEGMTRYQKAILFLKNNKQWRTLVHLVLTAGNYMNSSNKTTSGAWGFEISTGLQKLAQTKANGNSKYSLVHWLADVIQARCPEMFDLAGQLEQALEEASTIRVEDLKADMAQLVKGCDLVERELKACSGDTFGVPNNAPGSREFIKMLKPFLDEQGTPVTKQIKSSMAILEKEAKLLLDMHGEVASKCSTSQLMATAVMFTKSLVKARDENILMKHMEEKKQKASKGAKKAADSAQGNVAPALAAATKQLDKQIKADQLNKKLKNSFKKSGTKTKDNNIENLNAALEKIQKNQKIQSA